MAEHRITTRWTRDGGPYERGNYVKEHAIRFQGGQSFTSSAAADLGGDPTAADPEQILLAALSSCHMLTFLAVAANRGYTLDEYADDAECFVGKDADGRTMVTRAVLRPRATFSGEKRPSAEEYAQLHARSHKACFIANSVRTDVQLEPSMG